MCLGLIASEFPKKKKKTLVRLKIHLLDPYLLSAILTSVISQNDN